MENKEKIKINRKDRKILNILSKNSRLSSREIARIAKLSPATVIARIKKLENAKVIKRFSTVIDYEKLGYEIETIIEIRVLKGKSPLMKKKILENPMVSVVYDVTGDYDIIALARFKSKKELNSFLDKLQSYEFIERTNTKMILESEEGEISI